MHSDVHIRLATDEYKPQILKYNRHYKSCHGLKTAGEKFKRWISEYEFIDIKTADQLIDWKSVPRIDL